MSSIFEQLDKQLNRKPKEVVTKISPEKIAQLEAWRRRALQQMEQQRGTRIIPYENVHHILPNIPITLSPQFQNFAQRLRIWRHRETAGMMQIDFQAYGQTTTHPHSQRNSN